MTYRECFSHAGKHDALGIPWKARAFLSHKRRRFVASSPEAAIQNRQGVPQTTKK